MADNTIFETLAEEYGLKLILEQNDIDDAFLLCLLWQQGLLDLEDYIFTELEITDED